MTEYEKMKSMDADIIVQVALYRYDDIRRAAQLVGVYLPDYEYDDEREEYLRMRLDDIIGCICGSPFLEDIKKEVFSFASRTRDFFFVMQYEKEEDGDRWRWAHVCVLSGSDNIRKLFSDKRLADGLVAVMPKSTLREAQESSAMLNRGFKKSGCYYFDRFIAKECRSLMVPEKYR